MLGGGGQPVAGFLQPTGRVERAGGLEHGAAERGPARLRRQIGVERIARARGRSAQRCGDYRPAVTAVRHGVAQHEPDGWLRYGRRPLAYHTFHKKMFLNN